MICSNQLLFLHFFYLFIIQTPINIKLTQIRDSINYLDEEGYVYSYNRYNNNRRGLKSF